MLKSDIYIGSANKENKGNIEKKKKNTRKQKKNKRNTAKTILLKYYTDLFK